MWSLYWGDPDKALFKDGGEMNVEIGARMLAPFTDHGQIVCSATPAGTVAATLHVGPYTLLGGAHDAVRRYCIQNHRPIAGPYWEVYGHWTDDPSKLETEVVYLLK